MDLDREKEISILVRRGTCSVSGKVISPEQAACLFQVLTNSFAADAVRSINSSSIPAAPPNAKVVVETVKEDLLVMAAPKMVKRPSLIT